MTGATKASKREARAIRRACPQEAIRRASIRPDDAAAAAATTMASLAERKDPAMDGAFEAAAKEAAGPVLSEVFEADDSEEEQDEMTTNITTSVFTTIRMGGAILGYVLQDLR